MSVQQERRKYPRSDINWPVLIRDTIGAQVAEMENLSGRGALIRSHLPLRPKDKFKLHIIVPGNRPVNLKAEVAWLQVSCAQNSAFPCGMGVRFLRVSKQDFSYLAQMVNEHNGEKTAPEKL